MDKIRDDGKKESLEEARKETYLSSIKNLVKTTNFTAENTWPCCKDDLYLHM